MAKEINKKSIDKNNDKIRSINTSSKELKDLLSGLEESRLGGYKLNHKQKERLQDLIKDVESITDYFDNYKNIINNISSINDNLKYQKDRNNKVENDNNILIKENQKLKILYIAKYFLECSDENHAVSVNDICDYLNNECGITAKRRSIYSDMNVLRNEFGMDIDGKRGSKYYRLL